MLHTKIVSEYDQENITTTNCKQAHDTMRKSHTTITRHLEEKLSKATNPLFPIKMIAKLEWPLKNTQQNIEQLQNPAIGATNQQK